MWFGTDGSYDSPPLLMREGEEWAAFDVDGTSHFVQALALSGPGAGWIGTDNGLLHFALDQGSITLDPVAQVQQTAIQAIAVEKPGNQ